MKHQVKPNHGLQLYKHDFLESSSDSELSRKSVKGAITDEKMQE